MVQISVLMTAYNREKFISESIESVLNSSFQDFELIIVDDCSLDNTLEIARDYASRDSRIRIFSNNQNLGDYPNRNVAAGYAVGKYIKYLDSDDLMSPFCLEIMYRGMESNKNCAFGVSSRISSVMHVHIPKDAYRVHFFVRGILDLGPSFTIIRRDIFMRENGFMELRCVSDFEFWLRLALNYSMIEFEKDLILWREHGQQEMSYNSHVMQTLRYTFPIIEEKLFLSELNDSEILLVIKNQKKGTMRYLIKNVLKLGLVDFFNFKRINKLKFSDAF